MKGLVMETKIKKEIQNIALELENNSNNNDRESSKNDLHDVGLMKIEECDLTELLKEEQEKGYLKKKIEIDLETSIEYFCDNCDFKSFKKLNLINHMRSHRNRKSFQCKKIENLLERESNATKCKVWLVSTMCHNESLKNKSLDDSTERSDEKSFQCTICEYIFFNKNSLIVHMSIHTDKSRYKKLIKEQQNGGSIEKSQHEDCILKVAETSGEYICYNCGYKSYTKPGLTNHILQKHQRKNSLPVDILFLCTVCDYKSYKMKNLNIHTLIHSNKKTLQCNICKYRSAGKTTFKKHMMIHTGEKPYQCNICEYKTNRNQNLKTHIMKHTGEKPYQCKICKYKTSWSICLKKHMMKHR